MADQAISRPLVLVTNDDGISSPFLRSLVIELAEVYEVAVAAPLREKSWIGRAMTRHGSVSVEPVTDLPAKAWAIDGTPTDCVNIALGHLLERTPRIVVSGINIGYNTTVPLVYSSGTVAGALEGANWGLPAVAVSQALDREHFVAASNGSGAAAATLAEMLGHTARQTLGFVRRLLERGDAFDVRGLVVHNLNFPFPSAPDLEWERTVPARAEAGCFFQKDQNSGHYNFSYRRSDCGISEAVTDRQAVESGKVSWSILNFGEIARV